MQHVCSSLLTILAVECPYAYFLLAYTALSLHVGPISMTIVTFMNRLSLTVCRRELVAGSLDRATLEGFADDTMPRNVADGEIVARQDDPAQEVGGWGETPARIVGYVDN